MASQIQITERGGPLPALGFRPSTTRTEISRRKLSKHEINLYRTLGFEVLGSGVGLAAGGAIGGALAGGEAGSLAGPIGAAIGGTVGGALGAVFGGGLFGGGGKKKVTLVKRITTPAIPPRALVPRQQVASRDIRALAVQHGLRPDFRVVQAPRGLFGEQLREPTPLKQIARRGVEAAETGIAVGRLLGPQAGTLAAVGELAVPDLTRQVGRVADEIELARQSLLSRIRRGRTPQSEPGVQPEPSPAPLQFRQQPSEQRPQAQARQPELQLPAPQLPAPQAGDCSTQDSPVGQLARLLVDCPTFQEELRSRFKVVQRVGRAPELVVAQPVCLCCDSEQDLLAYSESGGRSGNCVMTHSAPAEVVGAKIHRSPSGQLFRETFEHGEEREVPVNG